MKKSKFVKRPGHSARRVPMQKQESIDRVGGELSKAGRILPQSIALEAAVLGALLLEKEAAGVVVGLLQADCFYEERHQMIYAAILRLYEKYRPIDLLTVVEDLRKHGHLETVGGPAYIAELTNNVASSANIEYHSRILIQYAIKRQVIHSGSLLIEEAYDDSTDSFACLDHFQNEAIQIAQSIGGKDTFHISSVVKQRVEVVMDLEEQPGIQGIPSGFPAIDEILGGFHPGDLGIIAGRPGMGKTALVLGIATEVARTGRCVDIFSLEMTKYQLVDRQAAQIAGVSASKIRKGTLSEADRADLLRAYEQLAELEIYIDDTAGIDLMELRAKAKNAKLKHNTGLIIIDYIQQIEYTGRDAFNREQAVAIIAKQLKKIAKELDIPVIVLAQLSRAVETRGGTKRPQLSDLRESGQIEQEADWVAFLYRPEYYQILEDEEGLSLKGVGEFMVEKNRHGETNSAKLKWEGEFTRFSNLSDELELEGDPLPAPPQMIIRPSKLNDDVDIPF